MYLNKLLIINYRSCKCVEVEILKDEPNILIGINDCGKTSLLKALELLLSEKPLIYFERDGGRKKDASNSLLSIEDFERTCAAVNIPVLPYSGSEIIIAGKFEVEAEDLIATEIHQLKAHSLWALENAGINGLWLCRSFDREGRVKNWLLTPDWPDGEVGLHGFYLLTQAQINKKKTEFELSNDEITNGNGVGRFSNLEIIRALYAKTGTNSFWVEWKWEKALFPTMKYLDWNSTFDQIMENAKSALKELIHDHLTPVKERARESAVTAQRALNEKLEEIRDIIAELLPQVQALTANIHVEVEEIITDLLIRKSGSDHDVHMDLQGDGIKRQIWFALIKASALGSATPNRKKHIWAFDEPETHLYPTAQRQLFEIIKEISNGSIQTMISTHSTVFIDRSLLSSIKIVSQIDNYTTYTNCQSIDDIYHSLELRNSDFLFYDAFLLVEGETEEHLIPALYKIYTGKSLLEDNIQLIPLGGASKWQERKRALDTVFDGFKKSMDKVLCLMDNDQSFTMGAASRPPEKFFFVGRQDIEDAIDNDIWFKVIATCTEITDLPGNIENIKQQIPSDRSIPEREKFLHRLSNHVKGLKRAIDPEYFGSPLPDKGKQLAEEILKHLRSPEQIPETVKRCFDAIRPQVAQSNNSRYSVLPRSKGTAIAR